MAWTVVNSDNGSAQQKVSSTSLAVSVTTTANDVVIVLVGADNISTTDGDLGDIASVTDAAGNVYTKARQRTNGQGAAAAGACSAIYFSKHKTGLTGQNITANFASALVASAIAVSNFTVGANAQISVAGGADGSPEDAATLPVATISGLASHEYLWFSSVAVEGPGGDTYTEDVDYTQPPQQGTGGGAAASNITLHRAWRIFTGTTDTYGPTLGTARDLSHVYVALLEAPPVVSRPRILQALQAVNRAASFFRRLTLTPQRI